MSKKDLERAKQRHAKFLRNLDLSPDRVKQRKKTLGREFPEWVLSSSSRPEGLIPCNGTKSPSMDKVKASNQYPIGPGWNKGGVMVLSKEDIKYAGKRV